jgi:twitching motility protein PilT
MDIKKLLSFAINNTASDLHLSSGIPPMMRINGELQTVNIAALDQKTVRGLLYDIMTEQQRTTFENALETDFSFEIPGLARFRINVFTESRGIAAAIRIIPSQISSLIQLNLPPGLKDLCQLSQGLVLVTGPTGSGKSTTLAALLDYINDNFHSHIITIEDPIEFVHQNKRSLIHQRELNRDTRSFSTALRSALREDPDVIFVGEMRDLETIRLALTAAETGHLVFSTIHTSSAAKTINRIIDVFPGDEKEMIRFMVSESLQAVISQTLLNKIQGGREAAFEIMMCTPAIRNLIRENKIPQLYSCIQTGANSGMQTLDQHLKSLVDIQTISRTTAHEFAVNKQLFVS